YSRDVSYVDDARSQQYQITPTTLSLRGSTICSTHCCISAGEGIRLTSGKGATKVWISGGNLVNVPSGAGCGLCDRLYMASSMAAARWITAAALVTQSSVEKSSPSAAGTTSTAAYRGFPLQEAKL